MLTAESAESYVFGKLSALQALRNQTEKKEKIPTSLLICVHMYNDSQ